jgi:hypothetical protein
MGVGPTGQNHKFDVGSGRFPGCVEIRGVSAIGDALVGARLWESGAVLRERDAILGDSRHVALEVVERHRTQMRTAWRDAFMEMVELEKMEFEDESYFRWVEEGGHMDVLAQAASRMA